MIANSGDGVARSGYDRQRRFSITAQTSEHDSADRDGNDSGIGSLGLGSINGTGKQVSSPVSVCLHYDVWALAETAIKHADE